MRADRTGVRRRVGSRLRSGRATALALLLVADLAVGATGGAVAVLHKSPAKPIAASTSRTDNVAARTKAIRELLARRSDAVLHHDRGEFMATIDPTQTAFVARQSQLFSNLVLLPLKEWRYVVNPDQEEMTRLTAMGRYHAHLWVPVVNLSYALRDFDAQPSLTLQRFTFVLRSTGWLIGNDSDYAEVGSPSGKGIWDFGPITIVQGVHALVIGHPRTALRLKALASLADDAVAHVSSVWGTGWSQRVVLLVPDTQAELGGIISEGNDLSQIAAVAVAQNGPGGKTEVGDRVIVNPGNFDQLSEIGRKVVLRHEVTHVASRSSTGAIAPSWLVEGFADYVGYLQANIPVTVVAHELRADVRAGHSPTALPEDLDFLATAEHLAQAYEMSWMACRLMSATYGQATLVRFYRAVGTSKLATETTALDAASRSVLGIPFSVFVGRWRDDVKAELR